jgi:hypothetical protein
MSSSMFQQAFHGGDKRRVSRLASAVKSALHWIASAEPSYLKPNSESMQKTIEGVYPYWLFSQPKNIGGKGARRNDGSLPYQRSALYLKYLKGGYRLPRAQQRLCPAANQKLPVQQYVHKSSLFRFLLFGASITAWTISSKVRKCSVVKPMRFLISSTIIL